MHFLRDLFFMFTDFFRFAAMQEDGFDVLFNGILVILVMTILGLNPWPLLMSFSTLMVSFAFAFGPSCAKYIEVSWF